MLTEHETNLGPVLVTCCHVRTTGKCIDPALLGDATAYALKLAEAGSQARVDYIFDLYAALKQVIPADTIEALYSATSASRYNNAGHIRSYLDELKGVGERLGANERFLLQRIEGLERRVRSN